MAKSLKKSAKRAADDRQQDPSAANIDPRMEADIGRLVDKYKNRSESSLMDELLRVTEQQNPAFSLRRPAMHRANVVFPAPLCPTIPTTLPGRRQKSRPFKTAGAPR